MKDILLFGASGHGKVIAEIAEALGLKIQGFIDADESITELMGYKVIASSLTDYKKENLIVSIGKNSTRKKIVESHPQYNYIKLISPKANVSKRAVIEKGTVIMDGVTINSESKIGKHCIINTNASIDHDCVMKDYVHISPNVALAGDVVVGEGTHIGIGACSIQGVRIGKWCTIGAGAVIIDDIPDYAVVVGNPGRIIKYNK